MQRRQHEGITHLFFSTLPRTLTFYGHRRVSTIFRGRSARLPGRRLSKSAPETASGPSKVDYYEKIAELFDIDCEIVIDGPFMDHVNWADSVTGPVHSGAMLEVMRAGKSYLPALYGPNAINKDYLDATILIENDGALEKAILGGEKPAVRTTLERFASAASIPDPAKAAWAAFERITQHDVHA